MAEETSDTELGDYSVEVIHETVENLGYTHDDNGEVSYYAVASDADCLELLVDGVEMSGTVGEHCDGVSKDEIAILTADGHFITDGVGQLIQCDMDGTDAAANGQPLVLNLAHPMGMHSACPRIITYSFKDAVCFVLLMSVCSFRKFYCTIFFVILERL